MNVNPNFSLRLATANDTTEIYQLDQTLFTEDFGYTLQIIECILIHYPYNYVIVNNMNKHIVGYLLMGDNDEFQYNIELAKIGIKSEYRNQGLGRQLIQKLITDTWGQFNLSLHVRISNLSAIHLYTKCGFIPQPEQLVDYYNTPTENAYVMRYLHETIIG